MSNYENSGNGNWYYNGSYYPPHGSEPPPSEYEWNQYQVPPYPNFSVPPPNYNEMVNGYSYPPPSNQVDFNYYPNYNSNNANAYPYYNTPQTMSNYASYPNSNVYDYSQELESYKTEQNQEKPSANNSHSSYNHKYDQPSRNQESRKSMRR